MRFAPELEERHERLVHALGLELDPSFDPMQIPHVNSRCVLPPRRPTVEIRAVSPAERRT